MLACNNKRPQHALLQNICNKSQYVLIFLYYMILSELLVVTTDGEIPYYRSHIVITEITKCWACSF